METKQENDRDASSAAAPVTTDVAGGADDATQTTKASSPSPIPQTSSEPSAVPKVPSLAAIVAAQIAEAAAAADSKLHVATHKYTFQMGEVWKVHNKHGLDYWVYGFTVLTADPTYAEAASKQPPPPGAMGASTSSSSSSPIVQTPASGKLSVYIGRRYHDFEWLRQVLVAEYPTALVPGLPGMGLEGALDKVTSIFKANDLSAITKYRRRGLDLFLNSLARSPVLTRSPLLHVFTTCSEEELAKFQKEWGKRVSHAPLLPSAWGSWSSMVVHVQSAVATKLPPAADEQIEKAKTFATSESETMRQVRLRVESFWDDLILSQEPNFQPLARENFSSTDESLNGILNVSAAVGRALQTVTAQNEQTMLNITCDLEFCEGLCLGLLEIVTFAEQLAQLEHLMAQRNLKTEAAYANVTKKIQDLSAQFPTELKLFHAMRIPVAKRALNDSAKLLAFLDPSTFPWESKCGAAVRVGTEA